MLDGARQKMMQKAMSSVTPSDTEVAKALAEIIAGLENEQAAALQELVDAAGLDADVRHDEDAREQQLLDTADAVAASELAEFYAGEMGVDNVDRAMQYQGVDWAAQKREWYNEYRERDVVDGPPAKDADQATVDQIAAMHVDEIFDVSLDQFRAVVEWDRGAATQELLAGPLVGHTDLIEHVASELKDES